MKKKIFDWTTFLNKNNKIAVHCKTEEEATNFCKMLHEHNLTWSDGFSYLSVTYYNCYKNEICYTNEGTYARKNYFIKYNYTILEYSDYNFEPSKSTTESEESEMKNKYKIKNCNYEIKDYKIDKESATIVVFFTDGDVQKAKCLPDDTYEEQRGFEICVMKHLCGGKTEYRKFLKNIDIQIKAVDKAKEEDEAHKERIARKKAKKAARAERKRAARIAEMKEAYLSALKEYNGNVDFNEDENSQEKSFEELLASSKNNK